jgi:hypothetical protein
MLTVIKRLPAGEPAGGERIDVPGAVLVTAALAALQFGARPGPPGASEEQPATASGTVPPMSPAEARLRKC